MRNEIIDLPPVFIREASNGFLEWNIAAIFGLILDV
jgi:hypothetical protein